MLLSNRIFVQLQWRVVDDAAPVWRVKRELATQLCRDLPTQVRAMLFRVEPYKPREMWPLLSEGISVCTDTRRLNWKEHRAQAIDRALEELRLQRRRAGVGEILCCGLYCVSSWQIYMHRPRMFVRAPKTVIDILLGKEM